MGRRRAAQMNSSCRLGALVVAVVVFFAWSPASASAAATHVFDPVLSLTGGCAETPLDPVPDPGCPGSHAPSTFASPASVTTDFYGNVYVASNGGGAQGRIDIFDPQGFFITEVSDPEGPLTTAVDSTGQLYVVNDLSNGQGHRLVRYTPTSYEPASGVIEYGGTPVTIIETAYGSLIALAINMANDHLFANLGNEIVEYSSAAEGNEVVETITNQVTDSQGSGLAVDSTRGRIYASSRGPTLTSGPVVKVLDLSAPHSLLATFNGSTVPAGGFVGPLSIAVDEDTGHVFVFDQQANRVYELTSSGAYVGTIEHGFQFTPGAGLAVDNGLYSPNGGMNENGRYLYVPSHPNGEGHSFAFGPEPQKCIPEVDSTSAAAVTETEAELQGVINPCSLPTAYVFEYTTQQSFDEQGFAGATVAGGGQLPGGSVDVAAAAIADDLIPDTEYRFRLVATNDEGADQGVGSFATYPDTSPQPCANDGLRLGFSALLPDCRGYELVTPASTNGRSPRISNFGTYFAFRTASPTGDKVAFQIEGGSIPGSGSSGWYAGDPFVSKRDASGWSTEYTGPTPLESPNLIPGATSPDQGYSFWSTAGGGGTASVEGHETHYVRYPDGHSELVGRGSLGTDVAAVGLLISEGGGHTVFATGAISGTDAQQLEPNAPPEGIRAIYDRTGDGVTHVVSLLPGNVTPNGNAVFRGVSLDGRGVAFSIGETLYLRHDNTETFEIGDAVTFAGISEGGSRIFYLEAGKLYRFDAEDGGVTPFTPTGSVVPVNVSADGSSAYFVSTGVLTSAANPLGVKAAGGKQNLYLSKEGAISFVGTVTERDVEGESADGRTFDGLGLWSTAASTGSFADDPSRTTPDGNVLIFQSRAALTDYDSEGHVEVYLYDSSAGTLVCLSCNPSGAGPTGRASLQSESRVLADPEPLNPFAVVKNLRSDGRRAFFQSSEALVPRDTDGLQDVYEWEDQGVGSCARAGGCVYLISSGHSRRTDYLYGVSDSGDDVFFTSADQLVPKDTEETSSIYDARVGGGFAETLGSTCEGEGCHLPLPTVPELSGPRTSPAGKATPRRHCRRGQRKIRRHGKVRCVKKHRRHHRHKSAAGKGVSK
jgi:hypothetical protein